MSEPDCTHGPRLTNADYGLYVYLRCGVVARTVSLSDSVNIDYDETGNALGVEVLK